MDSNALGSNVHNINVLTVVANESYENFSKQLQNEIAEVVADRPRAVNAELFRDKVIKDNDGKNEQVIDNKLADKITFNLIRNGYVNDDSTLTDKYYEDRKSGILEVAQELQPYQTEIINILDSVYSPQAYAPEDARNNNIELRLQEKKLQNEGIQSTLEQDQCKISLYSEL